MRRLLVLALAGLAAPGAAQERPEAGPVILSAGAVFPVEVTFPTPGSLEYQVAFEVATTAEEADQLNVGLNTVARFINMHAQAGVPLENIRPAIVVHGPAGWDLLDHESYQSRTGLPNPNAELLRELMEFGTRVILCGQTAASRGIPTHGLLEGVEISLSAITAFVVLQEEGYTVNPW
jgi:intracellular sulfur oxidation DsrE/DsrF family protein